jgi:hypothetical protein
MQCLVDCFGIRGEETVPFGRPLPVPAPDFKKLRPVPANLKARPGPRASTGGPRALVQGEIRLFCRKKKLKSKF